MPCHTQTLDLPGENLDGLGVGMAKLEVIQNESLIEFQGVKVSFYHVLQSFPYENHCKC